MSATAAWQEIRALRARPPGLAGDDSARRATFNAALEQAQQLAEATEAAGYAAKPLPLFYALSQAGRAIAAARLTGDWVLRGHGVGVRTDPETPVPDTEVRPQGGATTSFAGVATAIGSEPLAGPVSLGQLWAAQPDLEDVEPPAGSGWPVALPVRLEVRRLLDLSGRTLDSANHTTNTGGWTDLMIPADRLRARTKAEAEHELAPYPSLAGVVFLNESRTPAGDHENVRQHSLGFTGIYVARPSPTELTTAEHWDRKDAFVSHIDEPSPDERIGWLLPGIAGGPAPNPLMLWWALLVGLSSLARYEPAAWSAAIDPSTSTLAVGLERILDRAAVDVPKRILEALRAFGM